MMDTMMNVMMNSGMMDTMSQMASKMMEMMDGMMSAMPITQFGNMMGVMMDTFSEQMATSEDPFVDMANTMGSMMYSFMDGMTGNVSDHPAQEFALTMGEMINQFMVGLTGGNENPAQALGDMMGSMMGSMMSGMTGDTTAPLQSFTTIMSDMMSRFMSDMSSSMTTVMDPMIDMMNTMMNTMDGNMEVIASMFDTANGTMQSMIAQSPTYMATILRLSDDIGAMADRIGDMADRIVETQIIQSPNFLATQANAINLIDMLLENQASFIDQMGFDNFSAMMGNLEKIDTVISSMNLSEFNSEEILPSQLYMQTASGEMISISEADLMNLDGAVDITQFLNGNQLLVGFTIPNSTSMSLNDLMNFTTLIQSGGFDISQLPMFNLTGGSSSINDMSTMMSSMMGMFMGSGMSQSGSSIDTSMMAPFMDMMESFMGGMDSIPMEEFSTMMNQMMQTMSESGMMDSMMNLSDSMMGMMSGSLSAMPLDSFNTMMSTMMQSFGTVMSVGDTPMDAMAYTMGSMMLSFMEGMTGADGELAAHEFARTMGEMIHQFMVGVTGSADEPAAQMGNMMGSMMAAFMGSVTGDAEDPLGTFMDVMTTMMTRFMDDFASNAAQVMEPMADMMNTMLIGIQGNTDYISSMFQSMNDTMQDMIQMSPEYMAMILRLSDDIGLMADRIGEMADRIVETEVIQSANFLATQQNTMQLITMLSEHASEYEPMMGEMFGMVMENLTKLQGAMESVSGMGNSMSTIVPSDLYLLDELGNMIKISETDLMSGSNSTDITSFLNQTNLLVGYTIPLNSTMSLSELLSMTQMIEGSGFSLDQLPIFANATSIMDINDFMGSMFSADSLSQMDLPVDQFNQMIQNFQSHLDTGASPMEIMGQTMGSMMHAFMSGMTHTDSAQTPLQFAELMGEMVREFMIGVTGDENAPAAAMGEMMGSMMGSFMASITGDAVTPMSSFTQTMMESFTRFADTATNNMLTMMDPAQELMATFVNGMDANMELFVSMFKSANGTIEELIAQSPLYLDTMLRLSDDIGVMAGRINEMADRIVDTQVIMSENFLATQANAMELMALLSENSELIQTMMGSDAFIGMMETLSSAMSPMASIASYALPPSYASTLYLQCAAGELIALSSEDLLAEGGMSSNITSLLEGATLLVGYTIPTSSVMSMSELMNTTVIMDSSTSIATLPIFASDMSIDMADMIRSMMNMMMGSSMGLSMEQSVSAPFMAMMESFAAGMGLSMEQFEGMFDAMMDSMMVNDMISTMMSMAQEMMSLTHMDQFFAPDQMVDLMMNTFMAEGTPMATMADMMGSMMSSFVGEMTGVGANATPMQMAYSMGEMMKSFMAGVTADHENPALAMGEMMGSMMGAFMDSVTGEGEDFTSVMHSLMEQMSTTIMANMSALMEPMNDLFMSLGEGMDDTIAQMQSMMETANNTMGSMMNQSDAFIGAMSALSEDMVQMAYRVDDMMDRVEQTMELQSDNFMATQQNLNTFIDSLHSLYVEDTLVFEQSGMTAILTNLQLAQSTLETQFGTDYLALANAQLSTESMNTIDLSYLLFSSDETIAQPNQLLGVGDILESDTSLFESLPAVSSEALDISAAPSSENALYISSLDTSVQLVISTEEHIL